MPTTLCATEIRVIGCLMEKSVTTPDQYPLTLNALTNACNQKSSRDPVMQLDAGEVQHAIRGLQDKHLVRVEENFKSQVEKYTHRLCNTPFSDYQFDAAQFAAICVLLLRGPRTPGEIRANSGRLHTFDDNEEVVATLESLMAGDNGTLVKRLPRTPGRRDAEYMHLLGEDIEPAAFPPADTPAPTRVTPSPATPSIPPPDALEARIERLEAQVSELQETLQRLTQENNH